MSRLIFLSHNPSPAPSPALFPSSSNPNFHKVGVSSDQESSYPIASTFNGPYMGIVLVVLLMTFFLMAAFSVYVRRYAFSLDGGGASGIGTNPSGRARGMDRSAIEGLPIVVFHCAKGDSKEDASAVHEWSRRPDCVVCLTDFQEAESLRLLPKCEHCFHPECIDMWLFSHTTCPLCRRSLLPVAAPPPLPAMASLNPPHVSQSPS